MRKSAKRQQSARSGKSSGRKGAPPQEQVPEPVHVPEPEPVLVPVPEPPVKKKKTLFGLF